MFLYSKIPFRLSFLSLQSFLHFLYPHLYFMLFDSRLFIVPKINLSNDGVRLPFLEPPSLVRDEGCVLSHN